MSDGEGGMWLRTGATWVAVAAIVLVLVNAILTVRNQAAQHEVNQRQQVINQGVQLGAREPVPGRDHRQDRGRQQG